MARSFHQSEIPLVAPIPIPPSEDRDIVIPDAEPPSPPSPFFSDSSNGDEEEDDMAGGEIKAALPEEFSGEPADANRWLLAMGGYFALHKDKYSEEAKTYIFLNHMPKGQEKAFSESWLSKLLDDKVPDSEKTIQKIIKSFKAAFSPYDNASRAHIEIQVLTNNEHGANKMDTYISDFDLLAVKTEITDIKALAKWFIKGLDKDISLQLVLSGVLDTTKSMQDIYVKTSQIMGHFYKASAIRKAPRAAYGGSNNRRDPNAMDVDRLTLSPVERARLKRERRCFVCKKKGCSSRNHPGHPRYNPSQAGNTHSQERSTMARTVNTNPTPSSSQTRTDDKLEAYIANL